MVEIGGRVYLGGIMRQRLEETFAFDVVLFVPFQFGVSDTQFLHRASFDIRDVLAHLGTRVPMFWAIGRVDQ
jgi:hypothetical protein